MGEWGKGAGGKKRKEIIYFQESAVGGCLLSASLVLS